MPGVVAVGCSVWCAVGFYGRGMISVSLSGPFLASGLSVVTAASKMAVESAHGVAQQSSSLAASASVNCTSQSSFQIFKF